MAPTASFNTMAAGNGRSPAAKSGHNGRSVHLTSDDVIHLEHEHGAHK